MAEIEVFHRTWYHYEDGVKTCGVGERHHIATVYSEDEARAICKEWNQNNDAGEL
jgi:hypothetical protein